MTSVTFNTPSSTSSSVIAQLWCRRVRIQLIFSFCKRQAITHALKYTHFLSRIDKPQAAQNEGGESNWCFRVDLDFNCIESTFAHRQIGARVELLDLCTLPGTCTSATRALCVYLNECVTETIVSHAGNTLQISYRVVFHPHQ